MKNHLTHPTVSPNFGRRRFFLGRNFSAGKWDEEKMFFSSSCSSRKKNQRITEWSEEERKDCQQFKAIKTNETRVMRSLLLSAHPDKKNRCQERAPSATLTGLN